MRLTRADFLAAGSLAVGAAVAAELVPRDESSLSASPPRSPGVGARLPADVRRLLTRAGYGPRAGDTEIWAGTYDEFLEEQLSPEAVAESSQVTRRLAALETLSADGDDLRELDHAWRDAEPSTGQVASELRQAAVIRAVYSRRQLEQCLVEFWSDHLNVSQLKRECSWLKTIDDRLIRKHCLGKFRDLISASAHSPAMLLYLDNDQNRKKDSAIGANPNENYARELLELHTVGVDCGYTLKDIQEVARCLTGWTIRFLPGPQAAEFAYDAAIHDDGPKRVLGVPIPAGQGIRDGEQVIDILCNHPSTAGFIARKLVRRFVADDGQDALIGRLARVFTRTGGDLRQVVGELFRSREFLSTETYKLKRPFDFVISALRVTGAETDGSGVLPVLARMGQLPHLWPMPDGYPDRIQRWLPGLRARWEFATALLDGGVTGVPAPLERLTAVAGSGGPAERLQQLALWINGSGLSKSVLARLALLGDTAGDESSRLRLWTALLLSSPEFQRR